MGFTRWVLGSVAHPLAHESTVPTLVLHENETNSLLGATRTPHDRCVYSSHSMARRLLRLHLNQQHI